MKLERTVLKDNQMFLVTDLNGDILANAADGLGLYYLDTRFLSQYELQICDSLPHLLSAAGEYNFMTNLQLANSAMLDHDGQPLAARTVSLRRNRFLHRGLHERIGVLNYNPFGIRLRLRLSVSADFRDMFDVRGYAVPASRGTIRRPEVQRDRVSLSYEGLDGRVRSTELVFDPPPSGVMVLDVDTVNAPEFRVVEGISGRGDTRVEVPIPVPKAHVEFDLEVPPKQVRSVTVHALARVAESETPANGQPLSLDDAFIATRERYREWDASCTRIHTDHEIFNAMLEQARHDLRLLVDDTGQGLVPSAGIPWFAVPFGRDSLIVGSQTLTLQPALAYGALRFLARRQGTHVNEWRDEEPGKILHEVRAGEMASLEEVPHLTYYGSVDSTPLFLTLLGELLDWTADEAFAWEMLPHVEAALDWIDRYGDLDGDGFIEYRSRSKRGIKNQGWKDSHDAIRYRDGQNAEPPIALVEVQGYVYAARTHMAAYFDRLGMADRARALRSQAEHLKEQFERKFWLENERFYALALDAEKRPVAVVSSNPGHCLWSGLAQGDHAVATARRLTADDMLCGWGVRTLSSYEPNFNPLSYHNGSVWPHDNSLLASGLKRIGRDLEATQVSEEVLEAGMRMPGLRLPELYCGFARDRRYHSLPAQYPVSCNPQAWAAGSVFLFLQTILGLRADAWAGKLVLRPLMPKWLNRVTIRHLRVGAHRVDIDVSHEHGRLRVEHDGGGAIQVEVEPPVVDPRV